MFYGDEIEGENDTKSSRKFILSDGKVGYGYRSGPYDFWRFRYEQGMMPDRLRGTFTSFEKLKNEVESYFKLKNVTVVKVED